jgi:hypothetical protein
VLQVIPEAVPPAVINRFAGIVLCMRLSKEIYVFVEGWMVVLESRQTSTMLGFTRPYAKTLQPSEAEGKHPFSQAMCELRKFV